MSTTSVSPVQVQEQLPPQAYPQQGVPAVRVVDVDMPFWSMVGFMVKWALASIPALFVVGFIIMIIIAMFTGFARSILSH